MNKVYSLIKNDLGFYQVEPKPSPEELYEHYSKKYYQNNHSTYNSNYNSDEIKYFENEAELSRLTLEKYKKDIVKNLLDLGCGEGFFSKHFNWHNWKIKCVDFSKDGIKRHNPELLSDFEQVDLLHYIQSNHNNINKYGLINLDNVLEHVIDPVDLLQTLKKNMNSETVLRIEVPNDFSKFQKLLVDLDHIKETWISPPEHLSYFNKQGLVNLLETLDFNLISLQSDFPIEQFLLNEHSNYWKNRSFGKAAHMSRVLITNYLSEVNINRLIDYREAAADLEFGRLLTAYVTTSKI